MGHASTSNRRCRRASSIRLTFRRLPRVTKARGPCHGPTLGTQCHVGQGLQLPNCLNAPCPVDIAARPSHLTRADACAINARCTYGDAEGCSAGRLRRSASLVDSLDLREPLPTLLHNRHLAEPAAVLRPLRSCLRPPKRDAWAVEPERVPCWLVIAECEVRMPNV